MSYDRVAAHTHKFPAPTQAPALLTACQALTRRFSGSPVVQASRDPWPATGRRPLCLAGPRCRSDAARAPGDAARGPPAKRATHRSVLAATPPPACSATEDDVQEGVGDNGVAEPVGMDVRPNRWCRAHPGVGADVADGLGHPAERGQGDPGGELG